MKNYLSALILFLFCAGLIPSSFGQGSLNPPGPPSPSMKTLDQLDAKLEKRIPISSIPVTITAPGSYYLTGNLTSPTDQPAITINSSNVTVDLMGFSLGFSATGLGSGSATGIFAPSSTQNVTVRNGFVDAWLNGVVLEGRGARVEQLMVRGNAVSGISVGASGIVVDCIATANGGVGIRTSAQGLIHRSTARDNGGNGLETGVGGLVTECTSGDNLGDGINVGEGSTVQGCNAYSNTANNIRAAAGSIVARCTAANGESHGIRVASGCHVLENTCRGNATQSGIFSDGTDNRIEGNSVTANLAGIRMTASLNLIIKNTASNNTTNYNIVANNKVGTVVNPANSPTIAAATPLPAAGLGTTDPWANFAF